MMKRLGSLFGSRANRIADEPTRRTLLPTERWTNGGGWTIEIPVGWQRDPTGPAEGFVPPSAVGRLSVFTQATREPAEVSDEFVRESGRRLLPSLDRGIFDGRAPADEVEQLGPDHMIITRGGRSRDRQFYAVVHVFPPGLIVMAEWHTRHRDDPDWPDGVAAARSIDSVASRTAPSETSQPVPSLDLATWCLWLKRRGAGRLRWLLMRHWDPIGVQGIPQARDEYDSYIGRLADKLRTDGSAKAVAEVLADIEGRWMGMSTGWEDLMPTAHTIVGWYAAEMGRLQAASGPA